MRPVTPKKLIDTFSRLGRPRLLVVGDLILDEYVWGGVDRVSPEAPIPVLRVERRERRPGGGGSVVANVAALEAEVHMLSVVGSDAAGDELLSLLEQLGCDTDMVWRAPGRATTLKTRHLGFVQHADRAVQQLLRVDTEDVKPVPQQVTDGLLTKLRGSVNRFDAILVSDYDKGLLSEAFLQQVVELAGGVPVISDPARLRRYDRYRGSYLICPNRYETALATGLPCNDVNRCYQAGTKLAADFDFDCVAVTMDSDGICLCETGKEMRHFATEARIVSDVAGAGDMVLAMLGLVTGDGGTIEDAVRLANVAAGIEIRQLGAKPIPRDEILRELLYQGHSGVGKLKSLEQLLPPIKKLKSAGKTVVFTNGCFDLLHFGHHHLLNQARRLGDCLIVAVNTDASIHRIKGRGRPLTRQNERVLMLSGLECVDYVILFDDDTPIPLLEALRPDVLVKGEEYEELQVVGRELVESYGGRVEFVDHVPGISTTGIIEKQRQLAGEEGEP